MDNITHSLTGALAARVIQKENVSVADQTRYRRTLFWLLVLCANLPDIDVLLGLFGNRLFSLQHHRGITHSLIFAPIFALLPTAFFYTLGKLKNFNVLWFTALLGIVIHIFFDLITAFGTQIFAPISTTRYSLDWMFIIDPIFTAILGMTLLLGRILSKHRKRIIFSGTIVVLLYLSAEVVSHSLAHKRLEGMLEKKNISAARVSVLPQPLSIFTWNGLAQTEKGVLQTFFSVLNQSDTLSVTEYENHLDEYVIKALGMDAAKSYMTFARHPWIRSVEENGHEVVEFQDLQFSIDRAILRTVGFTERSLPFVLRFTFSSNGNLLETALDGRSLTPR